jgi:hypothetical protein
VKLSTGKWYPPVDRHGRQPPIGYQFHIGEHLRDPTREVIFIFRVGNSSTEYSGTILTDSGYDDALLLESGNERFGQNAHCAA